MTLAELEIQLPDDASIAALDTSTRARIAAHWLRRARGELTTAFVSCRVAQGLFELGAVSEVLWLAARSAGEEVRHSTLCRAVAERYAGQPLPTVQAREVTEATFGNAPARINKLLFAVFQSCINEGIATVYLQENLRLATSRPVRTVLKELLKDDVNHARFGWAHLASAYTTSDDKAHVAKALPTLLEIGDKAWCGDDEEPDFDCPEHGCLAPTRNREIVRQAFAELILPGFEHVGVDTRSGRAWFRSSGDAPQ